jgi:[FeFe] hydrogenase H-cluster maturation GTPase HydF
MELLPLGPVMIIDTPGMDDEGLLGELRVKRAKRTLNACDAAILVIDAAQGKSPLDDELIRIFESKAIPYLVVYNKSDLFPSGSGEPSGSGGSSGSGKPSVYVSSLTGAGIEELKERIARLVHVKDEKLHLVADLINSSDIVVLVTPIDKAAPKGRLILPVQQVIRDILEADAAAIIVKEFELKDALSRLNVKPALVITDSQVFAKASADTPPDVPLTSFSILMCRYKGLLDTAVHSVTTLDTLQEGDKILICEGCTHHRQCDDIGTVKLPRWIRQYCFFSPEFEFTSGADFPEDLNKYKLIVHCGGCMLNERELKYRQSCAIDAGVPITNYGVLIAYMQGILPRCVSVFPHLLEMFD